MKRILLISGSASNEGANRQLLQLFSSTFDDEYVFEMAGPLSELPMFTPVKLKDSIPQSVAKLKTAVLKSDAVIISTPEYLHNIPAVLKSALEWMTESGELAEKPILPITFTPHAPRGEHAMATLVNSLKASKAKVVAELPLYQNELRSEKGEIRLDDSSRFILEEALRLL